MAATNSVSNLLQMLKKEASCGICLDYLNDPVSIGCGHSFCRECVTALWKTMKDSHEGEDKHSRKFSCPLCKKTFKHHNFRTDWQLRNMVPVVRQICEASPPFSWEYEGEPAAEAVNELSCLLCQFCNLKDGASGKGGAKEEKQ